MSGDAVSTLEARLKLRESQLELITAIDKIADEINGKALIPAVVKYLAGWFEVPVAMLYLADRWSTEILLKAIENTAEGTAIVSAITDQNIGESLVGSPNIYIASGDEIGADKNWYLLGTSIELSADNPLGSIILARPDRPFSAEEIDLLKSAEDKLDSVVIQARTEADLQQRLQEIETIYRIDHIRDLDLPFGEMLKKVLQELLNIIGAEIGYVMLYDPRTERLALHTSTVDDLLSIPAINEPLIALGEEALQEGGLIHKDHLSTHIRSIMCLPLIMNQERLGVIGVINGSNMTPFNSEDERLLTAIGSQMDTAIFDGLEKQRLRKVLGRSVGPNIMEQLLVESNDELLKGERRTVTVLYADIRSSTELATRTEPELLVAFLNYFLEEMTSTVIQNEGTIDKFIGDEVMALFNAPISQADHALRAVQTGLAMQERYEELRQMWRKLGVDASGLGIGIATGELVVGEIGSALKSEYTAIGPAANLGARIQGAAAGGQLLICETTFALVKDYVSAKRLSGLDFQGINGASTAYDVKRILSYPAPEDAPRNKPSLDSSTHLLNFSSLS